VEGLPKIKIRGEAKRIEKAAVKHIIGARNNSHKYAKRENRTGEG